VERLLIIFQSYGEFRSFPAEVSEAVVEPDPIESGNKASPCGARCGLRLICKTTTHGVTGFDWYKNGFASRRASLVLKSPRYGFIAAQAFS
jgi:hypothetical protein